MLELVKRAVPNTVQGNLTDVAETKSETEVQTCEIDVRREKTEMDKLLAQLKQSGKIENFYAL